jgi:hypothetical protein
MRSSRKSEKAKYTLGISAMTVGKTFDETYPKYEFSDLVRLSLLIGTWIRRRRHAHDSRRAVPSNRASAVA